jgi:hypothetical protein
MSIPTPCKFANIVAASSLNRREAIRVRRANGEPEK